MTITHWSCLVFAVVATAGLVGCADNTQQNVERATAQVQRLTEQLDGRTTEAGAYVRVEDKDVKEVDPWGTRLQVVYSQGGLAESVVVRRLARIESFTRPTTSKPGACRRI